jgi:hypothetical protein
VRIMDEQVIDIERVEASDLKDLPLMIDIPD